ncbi:MAG TPA: glycosyltransferase, partial [Pseudonocardiaceae bacterium]|nr:glycosyltransferase [Pseudonocardiaceae bacterium]
RAIELGVGPLVLELVYHDSLPALVAAADAFAFPSAKEGFGLAAMEALAAGVPLVVSDLPVFRELFSGAARFASGPADLAARLREALTRPCANAQNAGQELARNYTWPAAAKRHLNFYRRI